MLKAIVPDAPDALFFAGDIGQRIFQHPFSWLSQGVDVRGRSVSLTVNYRTSQQSRRQADRLLPPAVTDVDGVADRREGIVSTFQGPEPEVVLFDDAAEEIETVGAWIADLVAGDREHWPLAGEQCAGVMRAPPRPLPHKSGWRTPTAY
jgi:hypothetical protein